MGWGAGTGGADLGHAWTANKRPRVSGRGRLSIYFNKMGMPMRGHST